MLSYRELKSGAINWKSVSKSFGLEESGYVHLLLCNSGVEANSGII